MFSLLDDTPGGNVVRACDRRRFTFQDPKISYDLLTSDFTRQMMLDMDLDSVYLQKLMVKRWVRGSVEHCRITSASLGSEDLAITGLGLSVGTSDAGLIAGVVEVNGLEDLERVGAKAIQGKIVFFNKPMDPTLLNTFRAYGGAAG